MKKVGKKWGKNGGGQCVAKIGELLAMLSKRITKTAHNNSISGRPLFCNNISQRPK